MPTLISLSGEKVENNEIRNFLERIAVALERIADSLERQPAPPVHKFPGMETPFTSSSEPVDVKNKEEGLAAIKEFLDARGVQIKTVPPEDAADDVINSLSDFLGKNYSSLQDLLRKIKSNMQKGGSITLSMKDYAQKDVSNVCQFATRLHDIAFLEQYKYSRSPKYLIQARTTTLPTAQNFFSGKWLERFVLLSVQRAVSLVAEEAGREMDFAYLLNPQIILPNGDDFELDLIFHVNGVFYWIEAKSGDYQQHISKYSKMSRMMNLDYEHAMMVLTDIAPDKSAALTSLFSMTVLSLMELESALTSTIRRDCVSPSGGQMQPEVSEAQSPAETISDSPASGRAI